MKKIFAIILALAMVLSLAACGSSTTPSTTNAVEDENGVVATTDNVQEEQAEGKRYAIILKTQATDYWMKMWNGIVEYAEENNIQVDMYASTSDTDYEGQLAIMENCINSGLYAGIGIAPNSGVNVISGVVAANKAGITIVNIDEGFDTAEMENQGATCVGWVASDNVSIGYTGAEYLCSLMEAGSQVAIIEGVDGNPNSAARAEGAQKAFEEGGMELVGYAACDWDMQKALDTAAAWITQYPDLKAIYCCNDGMAAGVRQAIANAGKTGEILLCGTDGDADAVEAVAAGNMTATVAQDPAAIGAMSLQLLVDAVENPSKYPSSSAPEKTPVDAMLIKE